MCSTISTLQPSAVFFHIEVTFEMRTVLSVIRLFNDTILNVRHHFILNRKGGEERKIAERQRERERESL
jgi:hypothetical protein